MIVFNLECSRGHGFEGWFKDAKAFKSQRRARKVACPVCADTAVTKALSAPNISVGAHGRDDKARERAREWRRAVDKLHRHIRENCEYVGDRFAAEARAIHDGVAEERGIYGEATPAEARELADDGVPFACIPKLPRQDA